MKCWKQIMHQPIKSILGIGLMSLAAAILVVCLGQYLAAHNTEEALENTFSSVALPVGQMKIEGMAISADVRFPRDLSDWAAEAAISNPDVVKQVAEHGLLSAHIPELTPINYTTGSFIPENISDGNWLFYQYQPDPYGMPYSTAMLVVTLDEVSEPMELALRLEGGMIEVNDFDSVEAYLNYMESAPKLTEIQGYTLKLTGRVHQVVSLQEGFRDPTGMIIRMTVTLPTLEELEALKLEAGAAYLVCGMDYVDMDWALRGFLATDKQRNPVYIDAFDLNKMEILSEEEQERFRVDNSVHPVYARYNGSLSLTKEEFEAAGAVRLTLESPNSIIRYEEIRDEDGTLTELRPITEKMIISADGTETIVPLEEYAHRYSIPNIARLEGSVEGFLASETGAQWQDALELMEINNHAFGVLGVEKVGYLADFARENSRIVEGREFTVEEQQAGSRVCVINEALAAANGLTVGDTITLKLYQRDRSIPYQSDSSALLTPSASFYFNTTPIAESAEYTIVGLWQGQELWGDVAHNEYILNPNTVIVPKSSVKTPMEIPDSVLFHTIILKNGALDEFRTLAARAGFEDRFICHDQGYSTIASNFHNYDALGKQILMVGVSVYAIVLLLFLIFFPASLGKALWTMESLGADRTARFIHVLHHSGILLTSAAVLGGMIGFASWDMVLDRLQTSAESAIRLNLESEVLLLIVTAQFMIAFGLSVCVACWLSRPRGLSRRR